MLKKIKKRGSELATEMRDPLAASQRRGKGCKSKSKGILIAVLIVLGGVGIGSPFFSQSNNSQNTPTPSSDPSPSYQQPTINKDFAVNLGYNGQEQFKMEMNDLGIVANWNLASLPYHFDVDNGNPLVCMMLHYQTTDELPFQKLTETDGLYGHTARNRRSNGALRSFTPSHLSHSVGHDNFNDACYLDIYPFAHPKGGSPTDVMTAQQVDKVMESWNKNVLDPIHEHKQTVIALCSKETERLYAEHVAGGTVKGLNKIYLKNTDKFISAEEGKLVSGYHPSAMYDPLHWSNMGLKTRVMDTFMTNAKIAITSDDNVGKCTFSASFLDTDSDFFKLMQASYLAGCSLGGTNAGIIRTEGTNFYRQLVSDGMAPDQAMLAIDVMLPDAYYSLVNMEVMRTEASEFYHQMVTDGIAPEQAMVAIQNILPDQYYNLLEGSQRGGKKAQEMRREAGYHYGLRMEEGDTREEALDWIESELSAEHLALFLNEELFTTTSQLAARLGRDEVISAKEFQAIANELGVDVTKLRENAQAMRDNGDLFAATSRLASEMLVRDVPNKEIDEIAERLGIKASTLRDNAQARKDMWEDMREAVSVYCAKTGVLLENCVSIANASPNLWDTVGRGILEEYGSTRGREIPANVQDIKNAGSDGLNVGNKGSLDKPQRIFTLKMSTGKEEITLSDKERQKILNDGKTDHAAAGKKRQGHRATESLYMISKVEKGNRVPVGKARNIKDALYDEENNPDGIRKHYGSGTYVCGPETEHDPKGHIATGKSKKRVLLNDAAILKEMKWQKDNGLDVVGFLDHANFKDGGRGKVNPHPERVRYIVILEEDAEGRSPQQQYDSLPVLDMTDQKKDEKETAGKKRKAESKTDEKDGTKKRKASRKGYGSR